jgi:fructose-1-phosphate kinase PfkB-like protein
MTILTAPWGSVRPILTVILNLAIDIATLTAQVLPTHKLRCGPAAAAFPGGINVARLAHRLKARCVALYPAAGTMGALRDSERVFQSASLPAVMRIDLCCQV